MRFPGRARVDVDGNAHGEDGTTAQLADHGDGASVSRDDNLGDGQAHAGSGGCIALTSAAVELVENQRLLERVDADPAIGDADHKSVGLYFGGYFDRGSRSGVLARVVEQMHQHFAHAGEIDAYQRQAKGQGNVDGVILNRRLCVLYGGLKSFLNGVRTQVEFEVAGVELTHLRCSVHHSVEPIGLLVDAGEQSAPALVVEGGAVQQGGDVVLDSGERCVKL